MQNNLTFDDMRAAIKGQLELIKTSNKPEVINGAKTVCMLTQAFVNVTKAEIDYAKAAGVKLGALRDITPQDTRPPVAAVEQSIHKRIEAGPGVTRYELKG